MREHAANSILGLDLLSEAGGGLKGTLEVLLGGKGLAIRGHELQRKVTNQPEEGGKVLGKVSTIVLSPLRGAANVNVLCEVDHEGEVVESTLIDGSDRVVDEEGREKQCQRKDGRIVLAVCVEGTNSLRIDNKVLHGLAVLVHPITDPVPQPETLCARVHGRSDLEAIRAVQENPVHEETLARTVHAHDGNDRDWVVNLRGMQRGGFQGAGGEAVTAAQMSSGRKGTSRKLSAVKMSKATHSGKKFRRLGCQVELAILQRDEGDGLALSHPARGGIQC